VAAFITQLHGRGCLRQDPASGFGLLVVVRPLAVELAPRHADVPRIDQRQRALGRHREGVVRQRAPLLGGERHVVGLADVEDFAEAPADLAEQVVDHDALSRGLAPDEAGQLGDAQFEVVERGLHMGFRRLGPEQRLPASASA
jgi:hypothetical protein